MCGIFGVMQHRAEGPPSQGSLRDTARRMHHRGPDACGLHAEDGVGLVHTRLSLVDLNERSNQPFWDPTRRYCLLYNGELYEYADLRAQLERLGAVFHTTSDTEVLLAALIRLGVDATVRQLEGMFAFALYDTQEKALVMARDRFGIKPLFVHDSDSAFVFASTVNAMRPWLALEPDPLTVTSYLQGFNGPLSGRSFYGQVTIVPPGGVVRVTRGGRARFEQLLTMQDLVDPAMIAELAQRSPAQLVDEVEHRLLKSVESQLCADVPVGAFCSGGVDSSLLMAMAARFHSDLRVFHADVEGPLSERTAAEQLSRHLKLEMKAVAVRDSHFVECMPDVVEHFGYPYAVNAQSVAIRLVSQLVHDAGIKAVLTGEGSDECFLGYSWLLPNVRARLGRVRGRITRSLAGRRPEDRGMTSVDLALLKGLPNQFEGEIGPVGYGDVSGSVSEQPGLSRSLATDGNLSYILRMLLHRNDAMGMAASVEARFPFLDSRLVSLAVNLPARAKIRFSPGVLDPEHLFFRDKWVVRQVANRYLPRALSQRHKGAFPMTASLRLQIGDGMFEDSFVTEWFGLSRPALRYLLSNASRALRFRLLHLEAWGHVCVRERPKAALAARLGKHVHVGAA